MKPFLRRVAGLLLAAGLLAAVTTARAAGEFAADSADFDAANLLYEKGRFEEAALAYDALLERGVRTSALLFNAGNAWFKSGRTGMAVARWLQAETLDPRNDRIQINLEFARKRVSGGVIPVPAWPAQLRLLTLNEWALLSAGAAWLCFGSLALGVWRPGWRPALRLPAGLAGVALFGTLLLLVITARDRMESVVAVVVTDEAVVHFGPLRESQSAFVARDGAEFLVTDRKDDWLRVADAQGREGWLLSSQVVQLQAGEVIQEAVTPAKPTPVPAQAAL